MLIKRHIVVFLIATFICFSSRLAMGEPLKPVSPIIINSGTSSQAVKRSYGNPCFEDLFKSSAGKITVYYYCRVKYKKKNYPSDLLFFKDNRLLGTTTIEVDNPDSTVTPSDLHWYFETKERNGAFKKVLAGIKESADADLLEAMRLSMPKGAAVGQQFPRANAPIPFQPIKTLLYKFDE